jgi:GDP-L-fucose synthase
VLYPFCNPSVIPGLLHKCLLAQRDGAPFIIAGSGAPRRQFIYATDLARLTLGVLRRYSDAAPLILAPDEADEVAIADVAAGVAAAMRFEGPLQFDASRADGQLRKTACNAKLRKLLQAGALGDELRDFAFTPLRQGLEETAAWLRENYPNVRT